MPPSYYTLATDTGGTAYFADASIVPAVTDAQAERCVSTPEGKARYPETYVLDGSTSACGWGRDPDAVEPGIFGPGRYPTLSRTDYVANSNDSPWLTNPSAPLTAYPRIYGDARTERRLRARLSLDLISQRLAGTDGLGAPGFTLRTLPATAIGRRGSTIVSSSRTSGPPPTPERRNLKKTTGSKKASDGQWRLPFDPARPLTTPRGLDRKSPTVRRALADTVQLFQRSHIPLALTPADAQHYASVPIPGCTDGEGCFDRVDFSGSLGGDGRYPDVNEGSSFIMATELTPAGPRTRTILTYSGSSNPSSPHHADQTALFSRGQWVTERFTDAEINAAPHLDTTVLHN